MFLAVVRLPAATDVAARAAAATGLAPADARQRLVGPLPRVLLVSVDGEAVEAARQRLDAAGFVSLALDPQTAPDDDERLIARTLDPRSDALVVVTGVGAETRHEVPWSAIELVQRGVRANARRETVTTSARKLSVGRTLLAGGLPITRKVETTETVTRGVDEPFAVLHRSDGGDDVILYERRLDFGFLGPKRQPVSRANLEQTLALVRERSGAPEDDRVARPGFVAGLPVSAADPVDVALHLVRLARRLA